MSAPESTHTLTADERGDVIRALLRDSTEHRTRARRLAPDRRAAVIATATRLRHLAYRLADEAAAERAEAEGRAEAHRAAWPGAAARLAAEVDRHGFASDRYGVTP